MEKYKAENITAAIVALGYQFNSVLEFKAQLEKTTPLTNWGFQEAEPNFDIPSNVPQREQLINNIKQQLPIIKFKNLKGIEIDYLALESKLSIVHTSFNPENYSDYLSTIKTVLGLRPNISTLGINFIANYPLGDKKLNLLNSKIQRKISNFEKNLTFQFVLPVEYSKDTIATYKIQKLVNENLSEGEDKSNRVYQVDANYNIDFTNINDGFQKFDKIKQVFENLRNEYYNDFEIKSGEFLNLQ